MTRVSIAPPDTEEDVSAEQVAAYLLAPERGWLDISLLPASDLWRKFSRATAVIDVPLDQGLVDHGAMMAECIKRIARAEQRHPADVLADIVGPARAASVGVACVTGESLDDRVSRTRCAMRAATERHARRLRLERATEDADSAARGAGESEE